METQVKAASGKKIKGTIRQKISPFLWFDNQAEEAVNFYTSIFETSKIKMVTRYGEESAQVSGMKKGSIMTVSFELKGLDFGAINGGPVFKFSNAVSFMVNCSKEAEIDKLWKNLSEGGTILMELNKYPFNEKYGWVTDKFGISWQLRMGGEGQKITPFLWFQDKAKNAVHFYTSVFMNSNIINMKFFGPGESEKKGLVQFSLFSLNGHEFMAMDGSKEPFSPAFSIVINCETQKEVDYYWEKLTAGGDESAQQCGWLQDKYGLSWQIVPATLVEMLNDPDPEKSRRVMQAMLPMKKLELNALKRAYDKR